MAETIPVHRSDLEKVHDVLVIAAKHHEMRDEMNACLHLAQTARLSPLTAELLAERDRVAALLSHPTPTGGPQ